MVMWENKLATGRHPLSLSLQSELATWCSENLKLTGKSPPTFHPRLARAGITFQSPSKSKVPLHPAWLEIVNKSLRQLDPSQPDTNLLLRASGRPSDQTLDIMAATIPNPATAAKAASNFTLDTISLFYLAWTESKSGHPVPKPLLLSNLAARTFRSRNPKRPPPDTASGEHTKHFKSTHVPELIPIKTHSSPCFTSIAPPLPFKEGSTPWARHTSTMQATKYKRLEQHMQKLHLLHKLTKSNPKLVTCEENNCDRAAAKRWPILPQTTLKRTYKAQCSTCRTKCELALDPAISHG